VPSSIYGTAGSDGPLHEDNDDDATVARPVIVDGTPVKIPQVKEARKIAGSVVAASSSQGFSVFAKGFLVLGVVAGCYGFVKLASPRRSSVAGRHGAYESKAYP